MESFGPASDRSCDWGSRFTMRPIRAIPQRTQHLARLLTVTAPEKRGTLTRETIGLVCSHLPVSDNDALGRWRAVMGAPPCLECLAVFEPMNDRDTLTVSREFIFQDHCSRAESPSSRCF